MSFFSLFLYLFENLYVLHESYQDNFTSYNRLLYSSDFKGEKNEAFKMSPTLRRKRPFFFLFAWKKKYNFFFHFFLIRKPTLKLLLLQHLCTKQKKTIFTKKKKGNCIAQYFINLKWMVLMMIRARPKVCKTHFDFFSIFFFSGLYLGGYDRTSWAFIGKLASCQSQNGE